MESDEIMENIKKEKKVNTSVILLFYILLVIAAKIIRHTILKATLVDMSVGRGMISNINNGISHFTLTFSLDTSDAVGTINSNALFQIFKIFGLSTTIDYEVLISFIWNLLFIRIIINLKNKMNLLEFAFLCMSIAVLNIWDFCLAKEPVQMLYFIAIFYILISKVKEKYKFILSLLIILFSTISYRNYYILIFAYSICAYFIINKFIINNKNINYKDILVAILLFGVVYFCMMNITKIIAPDIYENFMYFSNKVTTAKTDMAGIFKSSNLVIVTIDYLILVVRMLFPIELIRFGLSYSIYSIYQIFLTILLLNSFKNMKSNDKAINYAIMIFLGFLFASATFEPDFGSWVRHEAVALPVIFVAMGLAKKVGDSSEKYTN